MLIYCVLNTLDFLVLLDYLDSVFQAGMFILALVTYVGNKNSKK